jgi:stage VI sporulation protein D
MTEQTAGFRFDIYERIQLPEELPAIRNLQQIELLPHITGVPGQDQVTLKGYLALSADYVSEEEADHKQTYSHRIPVEIVLPVRADLSDSRMDVEIDRFDVELSTSRSLNVTGVLSISGVNPSRDSIEQEAASEDGTTGEARKHKVKQKPKAKPKSDSETINVIADMDAELAENPYYEDYIAQETLTDADEFEEQSLPYQHSEPVQQEQQEQSLPVIAPLEKEETKVAFKAKSPAQEDIAAAETEYTSEKSNNALEWRKLFLGTADDVRFERVRLCIAQREDTIQSIAQRYELSSREIALYNRLGESEIAEGQIVYIPKSIS